MSAYALTAKGLAAALAGAPHPVDDQHLRVTVTALDGSVLRTLAVRVGEDTEDRAAEAITDMITDFLGDDRYGTARCRDVTNDGRDEPAPEPDELERYEEEPY